MRLSEGRIVTLNSGKTVCIIMVDDDKQIYMGVDAEDTDNPDHYIEFKESDIILTIL